MSLYNDNKLITSISNGKSNSAESESRLNQEEAKDLKIKCGDIFVCINGRFHFYCYFCNEMFTVFEDFIKHIEDLHSKTFHQDEFNLFPGEILLPDEKMDQRSVDEPWSAEEHHRQKDSIAIPSDADDEMSKKNGQEENPVYKCEKCKKTLRTQAGFERHLKKHETKVSTKRKKKGFANKLKCQYCEYRADFSSKLLLHERIHTGERPFQCKICQRCFRIKGMLKIHIRTHSHTKTHECQTCLKKFYTPSNLDEHIRRVHLDKKPHKCDFCDMGFVTASEKKQHMRTHSGEKPFQCEDCGTRFKRSSALGRHRKQVHIKIRKFTCPVCKQTFATSDYLKNHIPVHTNETPFDCNVCDRKFRRKKALSEHMKLHSETKNYICKICGKEYAQYTGLYSHMKSHQVKRDAKTKDIE